MLLYTTYEKLVGILKKRKQTNPNDKHWLGDNKMAARTLNEKELNLLLLYIKTRKHAARDRAMVLMTYWGGMRVGEVAATKVGDVLANDGSVKTEFVLKKEQTKGNRSRTVVLSDKLRKELLAYLQDRFATKQLIAVTYTDYMQQPLFSTQKSRGFSRNTLCYTFFMLYKGAGLDGCSSHSGRRSYCTSLSAKGAPIKVIQELCGHRQLATTARYITVTTDMKKAAVELL